MRAVRNVCQPPDSRTSSWISFPPAGTGPVRTRPLNVTRWPLSTRWRLTRSVLVGDLNIAPMEQDVWSHKQLLDVVSHTPPETEGLNAWMHAGFVDAVRHFVPAEQKLYTWWSYRNQDWRRSNRGRRLDQ